jgi:hypothetical protein
VDDDLRTTRKHESSEAFTLDCVVELGPVLARPLDGSFILSFKAEAYNVRGNDVSGNRMTQYFGGLAVRLA